MTREELTDIGLHLRGIHFFILVASIACFAVIFGYKNDSVESALKDLDTLLNVMPSLDVSNTKSKSLQSAKSDWSRAREKLNTKVLLVTDGSSTLSELPIPEVGPASVNDLSSCANWSEISRVDGQEFTDLLKQRGISNIECRWMGEDELFVIPVVAEYEDKGYRVSPQNRTLLAHTPNSLDDMSLVKSVINLDQCANWLDSGPIDTQDFENKFTDSDMPILCRWQDENSLIVIKAKLNYSNQKFMVTPRRVSEWEKLEPSLFRLAARRTRGADLNLCSGEKPADTTQYQDAFAAQASDNGFLLCYWYKEDILIVFTASLNENQWLNDQNLHDKIGFKFDVAFEELSQLEEFQALSFETDDLSINWEEDNVNEIREKLNKQRLEIGEATILGLPIKQEIILYGGPPLLVIMQVYFLLHFRQLLINLKHRSHFIPWIGLYTDNYSKAVTIFTLTILPPTTMIFFAREDLGIETYLFGVVASISCFIAVFQAFVLSHYWRLPEEKGIEAT